MMREDIQAWATAYIEAQQDPDLLKGNHPLWWAVERFINMGSDVSPEDCWLAILEILSRDPPEQILGNLAAGPLEDLIQYHGPEFIEHIELESRRSRSFRHLLGGVWESSTPEIWARVQKSQGDLW
jgi:hypothetical protein